MVFKRLLCCLGCLCAVLSISGTVFAGAGGATVTYTVTPAVSKGDGSARVWLPYPLSNEDQRITGVKVTGNQAESGVYRDAGSAAVYLFARWSGPLDRPSLTMSFHVDSEFKKGRPLTGSNEPVPADIRARYLQGSRQAPLEPFKALAAKITKGKKTVLEKARAVYDWTIDNTHRDPSVQACGLGLPGRTLNQLSGGGKCADISSVFVTLARAAGVPARDVYGLRLAEPKTGEITGDFHCWAEFYLPGHGWVMVDPADVRKMMLVHKHDLGDPETKKWREFFWNGDNLFRIVLNKEARDVALAQSPSDEPINYFMYPYGEVDGKALNYFDPKSFAFKVELKLDE